VNVDVPRMLEILLNLGLVVTTARCEASYTVKVTGGRREASGVAETFSDAFALGAGCWVLN
jgi:hypothetical protein